MVTRRASRARTGAAEGRARPAGCPCRGRTCRGARWRCFHQSRVPWSGIGFGEDEGTNKPHLLIGSAASAAVSLLDMAPARGQAARMAHPAQGTDGLTSGVQVVADRLSEELCFEGPERAVSWLPIRRGRGGRPRTIRDGGRRRKRRLKTHTGGGTGHTTRYPYPACFEGWKNRSAPRRFVSRPWAGHSRSGPGARDGVTGCGPERADHCRSRRG